MVIDETAQTPQLAARPPTPIGIWKQRALAALFSITLFAGCLWLYTRSNRFSYLFHPDELGKADQIIDDYRNFRHPQLLLEVTHRFLKSDEQEIQSIVNVGRNVSAAFAAAAVVCLALTGYFEAGLLGMIATGILC